MPIDHLSIAARFAAALDAEDYSAARRLLANTCVYRINNATIVGPDAIIDSYQTNGTSAKQRFESVEYFSDVESIGPSMAAIAFTDRLRVGRESHEFRCRQCVHIGWDGLIEEITHQELPHERQRLTDFEARVSGCGSWGGE